MKKLLKILAVVLCLSFLCVFVSCGEQEEEKPTVNENVVAIAGNYVCDGTPLGMPMSIYLKIDTEEKFIISNSTAFTTNKGSGKVAEKDGTFMLIYTDEAHPEKTATFTVLNGNLLFSTSVPYGAASFSSEGTITFLSLAYEDLLDQYVGSLDKSSAMGGTIHYDFEMELKAGKEYKFTSVFAMGSDTYKYVEEGTFSITDGAISVTALKKVTIATMETGELVAVETPTAVSGTIANGVITLDVFPSPMSSSPVEGTMTRQTSAAYAGSYVGNTTIMGRVPVAMSLKLDKLNGYVFNCNAMGSDYKVIGTFAVNGDNLALTIDSITENNEPTQQDIEVSCKFENKTIVATVSLGGAPGFTATLYPDYVIGTFNGSDEEAEIPVTATLVLDALGNFVLSVDEQEVANGKFELQAGMMTLNITLKVDEETVASGIVSSSMINLNDITVNETTYNFSFIKA